MLSAQTVTWVRWIELSVALILAPAALSKAGDVRGFAAAIRRLGAMPQSQATLLAGCVIGAEIVLSSLLAVGSAEELALAGAAVLFAAFSGIAWLQEGKRRGGGPIPECGCLGGVLKLRIGRGSAILNLLVAFTCGGAAFAAMNSGDQTSLSLGIGSLVLMAALVAATYWLAQYAMSVMSAVDSSMARRDS